MSAKAGWPPADGEPYFARLTDGRVVVMRTRTGTFDGWETHGTFLSGGGPLSFGFLRPSTAFDVQYHWPVALYDPGDPRAPIYRVEDVKPGQWAVIGLSIGVNIGNDGGFITDEGRRPPPHEELDTAPFGTQGAAEAWLRAQKGTK